MPLRRHATMPRATPAVRAKSSALMITWGKAPLSDLSGDYPMPHGKTYAAAATLMCPDFLRGCGNITIWKVSGLEARQDDAGDQPWRGIVEPQGAAMQLGDGIDDREAEAIAG